MIGGGLVGEMLAGTVTRSYATGSVTSGMSLGGLIGARLDGGVTASYWDTLTSGQATSAGGTGLTTSQLGMQSSFAGWDFTNTWKLDPLGRPTPCCGTTAGSSR